MDVFGEFETVVRGALGRMTDVAAAVDLSREQIVVEMPRSGAHGDLSTNAAMVLARRAGTRPRDLAVRLAGDLDRHAEVKSTEVAGPGFVNITLRDGFWRERLRDVVNAGPAWGDSNTGRGRRINVEYVSANPTGPLHAAHARGAVVGDVLARLLAKVGYDVCREYYVNDAGTQVDVLGRTTWLRYREALGEDIGALPADHYPGSYLVDVAEALVADEGDRWAGSSEDEWLPAMRRHAIDSMMDSIRRDLERLGIQIEVWSSERALVDSGRVDAAMAALDSRGLLYTGVLEPPKGRAPEDWEPRPQRLFRATEFGDDIDRPIRKSDGAWTYFASDAAYHFDKFERGFDEMIDVWGADHGGYVKRMQAAVRALTSERGTLDVRICQLVNLTRDGRPVRMSKRAGTFVTLSDVIDAVGRDVIRFMMLTRRNDQPLDFDLERVTEQSRDNPVFYVQYAHARCRSVLRHAAGVVGAEEPDRAMLAGADLDRLADADELGLIRQLARWPRVVESAAGAREPHRIAFYLSDVAADFHALWNRGRDDAQLRFIDADDHETTLARLTLVRGVADVISSGLAVMGVQPVEELRS